MPTTVTGTLIDSLGQIWTNAPVQFIFQTTAGTPGPFSWNGGILNPMPPRINTDANGFFSIVMPANNEILPVGSYWQCIIGPSATYPAFVFNFTLTTGALDISPLFTSKAVISLVQSTPIPRAYNDGEVIVPPNSGQLYYDTSLKCLKYYENGQWNIITSSSSQIAHPTAPTGVLTGITGNPANPVPVVYFINANGLVDEKVTTITEGTKTFEMQFVNDTYSNANTLIQWHRTGYTADSCVLTVGNLLTIRGASSATVATIDGAGNASFAAGATITGNLSAHGGLFIGQQGTNALIIEFTSSDYCFRDAIGSIPANHGVHSLRCTKGDSTGVVESLVVAFDNIQARVPFIVFDGTNQSQVNTTTLHVANDAILIGQKVGAALGTTFEIRTDNSAPASFIDSWGHLYINYARPGTTTNISGNLHVTGTITSDAGKAFKITHPLDAEKFLMHGCLEGAEFGIYYRGEDNTGENSSVLLFLPHYFESLAAYEGRTVTLTQKFVGEEQLAILAASDVQSNSFTVRSSAPNISFYWEVKAVRKDVSPLEVEPLKKGGK